MACGCCQRRMHYRSWQVFRRANRGVVGFTVITVVVENFKDEPHAPVKTRAYVAGSGPNARIDFVDKSYLAGAFCGFVYPFAGPTPRE